MNADISKYNERKDDSMKKKRNKKIAAVLLAAALIGYMPGIMAHAETVSVSPYGTMTYTLSVSGSSNKSVIARTSISSPSSSAFVRTTLQVQINATGEELFEETAASAYGASSAQSSTVVNGTSRTLAAFSAHEVVGTNSYVKYLANTF